jgi:HAD superfamily hydrolase (TIGR01509 family)
VTDARAVVFDFDGVLVNTEDLHLVAYQRTFQGRGWSLDRNAYFANYLGFDDLGLIRGFADDHGFHLNQAEIDAILDEKSRRYAEMVATHPVLYPAAAAAVSRLGSAFKLAIASGSLRSEILAILAANQLTGAFPVVVGADDVEKSKPAPDPYIAAVERLGVDAGSTVAIEDAPLGLLAAKTAGLRTIGITNSYPAEALNLADVVVQSLDEITTEMVDRLLRQIQTHHGGP